jgi:hypothetical protein
MARRTPAQVRRARPYPRLEQPVATIPGLSPRGTAAIVHLERRRYCPGAVREAFDAWERFLRDPYHRLFNREHGCGILMCCPDPDDLRAMLEAIVHALPHKDGRRLRAHLAHLDARW